MFFFFGLSFIYFLTLLNTSKKIKYSSQEVQLQHKVHCSCTLCQNTEEQTFVLLVLPRMPSLASQLSVPQ